MEFSDFGVIKYCENQNFKKYIGIINWENGGEHALMNHPVYTM